MDDVLHGPLISQFMLHIDKFVRFPCIQKMNVCKECMKLVCEREANGVLINIFSWWTRQYQLWIALLLARFTMMHFAWPNWKHLIRDSYLVLTQQSHYNWIAYRKNVDNKRHQFTAEKFKFSDLSFYRICCVGFLSCVRWVQSHLHTLFSFSICKMLCDNKITNCCPQGASICDSLAFERIEPILSEEEINKWRCISMKVQVERRKKLVLFMRLERNTCTPRHWTPTRNARKTLCSCETICIKRACNHEIAHAIDRRSYSRSQIEMENCESRNQNMNNHNNFMQSDQETWSARRYTQCHSHFAAITYLSFDDLYRITTVSHDYLKMCANYRSWAGNDKSDGQN